MTDLFTKALEGDREAQLMTMVQTLATHLGLLLVFVPRDKSVEMDELHRTTRELCESALEYLKVPPPPPYTQNEKFLQGMCGYKENLVVCILTAGHEERSKTPHTNAEGCPMGEKNKVSGGDEVIQALKNYGADTTCGACMEVAFTGVTTNAHTCKQEAEPMNLRLHQDGITWFIRGFGYSGNGLTPGLALRDLARHLNSVEKEQWPVEGEPLLSCVDCKNTESCAGAMARAFNHGRCMHCGGYFKVVRA